MTKKKEKEMKYVIKSVQVKGFISSKMELVKIVSIDEEFEKARKVGAKDKRPRKKRVKKLWTGTEKQGSGRAYWFNNSKDAKSFAKEKGKAGHAVTYDKGSKYVWHSFSSKKHSDTTKKIMHGIDPLSAKYY
jgi:aryl-phospho-beta-D-glucosidase BglC (GH1 family)